MSTMRESAFPYRALAKLTARLPSVPIDHAIDSTSSAQSEIGFGLVFLDGREWLKKRRKKKEGLKENKPTLKRPKQHKARRQNKKEEGASERTSKA
jgi:hypothetical protein